VGKDKRAEIDEFYPIWRNLVKENPWFSEQELYSALGIENKFGNISVVEANGIMRKLSLSACEGGIKVMLVMFPERMNQEAANKLLKSLEEPQPETYYFLISHNPTKIISTILSRCRIIELHPIDEPVLACALEDRFGLSAEDAAFWAKCSGGSYGKAAELIQKENGESENGALFMQMLEMGIKKDLVSMFDIWNNIAGWGKEAQKSFCVESLEILRKIYMTGLGVTDISYANKQEQEKLKKVSEHLKPDFYEKGYNIFNNAIDCIERNVNPKFIFCDLCNRIYYNA
jgi:DNA polymerase-3 subunit delta'